MEWKKAFQAFWSVLLGKVSARQFEGKDPSHLRLLALLQSQARLLDFLQEDLSSYNDAEIGAAVRKIHADASKVLEEHVTLRPLITEAEGAAIQIPPGFDPRHYKVVGKVKGNPPYTGTVIHRGWKAHKESLPRSVQEDAKGIVAPAEIEVK